MNLLLHNQNLVKRGLESKNKIRKKKQMGFLSIKYCFVVGQELLNMPNL